MKNTNNWINDRLRFGWVMFFIGLIVCIVGVFSELKVTSRPFDFRIITGLGLLFLGIGLGNIVRYRIAAKDSTLAKRIVVEELDERNIIIHAKSGNRAYWVSTGLVYIGLIWVSFSSNGKLPPISEDILWYLLAFIAILPFGVYLYSIIHYEKTT